MTTGICVTGVLITTRMQGMMSRARQQIVMMKRARYAAGIDRMST